jgi:hypothetical protein
MFPHALFGRYPNDLFLYLYPFMIILLCVSWWLSGMAGFIFWWTSDYDFTAGEIFICILSGFAGPIAWIMGYFLHHEGTAKEPKIIIRKR